MFREITSLQAAAFHGCLADLNEFVDLAISLNEVVRAL